MKNVLGLLIILFLGYGGIFYASRWLEKNQLKIDENYSDEDLYFSARQLSLLGSDFKGLIADWYWIKSLQYLGDKVVHNKENTNINDLHPLNPRLVYPMLDTASTLDPQFMTLYSFGAAVLPAINNEQAIKLLEKGIAANPDEWRLYHNLGYIYWSSKDYTKAAETYAKGAAKPDSPVWMKQMSVNMQAQGGSRDFARQIYKQMFDTAEDEQTRSFAELRFAQIESLDERDAVRSVLQNFQKQNNRCINNWREISVQLNSVRINNQRPLNFDKTGTPVDPTGIAYLLLNENSKCDVALDLGKTKIPSQ